MFKTRQWLTGVAVMLASWSALAQAPKDLGHQLADGYVRPAMARFVEQSAGLENAVASWCRNDGRSDVEPVQRAFGQAVQAWAGIEFLRFGPLVQDNRYEKLAFWPDTRGVMPRQVRALLAESDTALLAPGELAARSVAVQGLPALEFVLYDTPGLLTSPPGPETAYACAYAVAVAANIVAQGTALQQAWSPEGDFGRLFTEPAADNALYRNQQEIAAEAIKALSTGLQFAREAKLSPVLGDAAPNARPNRAAWRRSGMSGPALSAGIAGIRAFYDAGQYAYSQDNDWIGPALGGELERVVQILQAQDQPLSDALRDEAGWQQYALVALMLNNAKRIVDEHVAPALGVTIGFNALDGD